jgi:hypothetical protein
LSHGLSVLEGFKLDIYIIINLNTDTQKRVDDVTIGDFYNNNKTVEYAATQLLCILKTKSPPLTDDELTKLQSFITTSHVLGNNNNANLSGEYVHTIANFTWQWHKAIVKSIKYLEKYTVNRPYSEKKRPKNDLPSPNENC